MAFVPPGMGWLVDMPDIRDYSAADERILESFSDLAPQGRAPPRTDWRDFFDQVHDQQRLNASCAHACLGLLEYFERRVSGQQLSLSRRFAYKLSRRISCGVGDCGASLRTTWKVIFRFGTPPECHCPYTVADFDQEPEPFLFSFGQEVKSLTYLRLDGAGLSGESTLKAVKGFLSAGFPSAFGFSVNTSLSLDPDIGFPTASDGVRGGQAVIAVGFDDARRIRSDKGALLIRNSWGGEWGDNGYGWLPYAYVRQQLARDFWTVLKPEWLASGEFRRPEITLGAF